MKRSSKLKRVLLVFFISSIALFLAFFVCWMLTPLSYPWEGMNDIGLYMDNAHKMLGEAFILPFNKDSAIVILGNYNMAFLEPAGESIAMSVSVVAYVFTGIIAIMTVLGLIFVLTKKKGIYILFTLLLGAALYAVLVLSVYFTFAFAELGKMTEMLSSDLVMPYAAMVYITSVLGYLAVAMIVVTYILGLVFASKSRKQVFVEEEAEAKTIAEAVGDPEAIQEGEELVAPDPELIVTALPEPSEEVTVTEPVEELKPEEEPKPEEKPEQQPGEDKHVEVNVNNNGGQGMDQASLASLLREVVRDIVRDEIARNNVNQPQQQPQQAPNGGNQTITGATFGGPLVVQYFNGGINGVSAPTPVAAPAPAQAEEKKEEPKVIEAPKDEAKPEEKPAPRPLFVKKEAVEAKSAPAPVAPVVEAKPAEEVKKYERLTFAERLLQSEKDIHDLYNELKNEILSWGVKSRVSAVGDTFRLHKKMYVRITVAGKSLKLYFALNPADYANSTIPVQDASGKDMYQEIPLVFKVKSGLSVRRCKELIQDAMEKDGLEQGEIGKVNWVKELKAELVSGKKKDKDEE